MRQITQIIFSRLEKPNLLCYIDIQRNTFKKALILDENYFIEFLHL